MEIAIFIAAVLVAAIVGYRLGNQKKPSTSAEEALSAFLIAELSPLVEKLAEVKAHDMEQKNELLGIMRGKILTAKQIHESLLTGAFESVHQEALKKVSFLTWD